jgi:hypothetical protein|tara:strand:+ start:124 stop:660 length:537 start_codon:yes stop_codon:yes gene_type:complete
MKNIILGAALVLSATTTLSQEVCRNYTYEQNNLLQLAFDRGVGHDYAYTLAAIVQQESFIGDYVVRINPFDKGGAYGITHITLSTAKDLTGAGHWEGRKVVEMLVKDDGYALDLAIKKLLKVQGRSKTFFQLWGNYNGAGPASRKYAGKILKHIQQFKRCKVFYLDDNLNIWTGNTST